MLEPMPPFDINFYETPPKLADHLDFNIFISPTLITLCICIVFFVFQYSSAIKNENILGKFQKNNLKKYKMLEKKNTQTMVGILGNTQKIQMDGFSKYLYALTQVSLPSLWVNTLILDANKSLSLEISGQTLNSSDVQVFYHSIAQMPCFNNLNLRILEISNLPELDTEKENRLKILFYRNYDQAIQTQDQYTLGNLSNIYRFTITNRPEQNK